MSDPCLERIEFCLGEWFAFGGHAVGQLGGDFLPQRAVIELSGDDDRSVVASFADQLSRIESEAGFLFECPVTGPTVLPEDWFDVLLVVNGLWPASFRGLERWQANGQDGQHR